MNTDLISIWSTYVQPDIDEKYRAHGDASDERSVRADVGWDWYRCFFHAQLHSYIHVINRAVAICAVVETRGGDFPVGMLISVPCFICTVDSDTRTRGFAWYLSDAPVETYDALGLPGASQMAAVLLDSAIQLSRSMRGDGTLLLHADPSGGDKLHKFYRRVGMTQLAVGGGAVTYLRWKHKTDEYFIFSPSESTKFCQRFDAQRASRL